MSPAFPAEVLKDQFRQGVAWMAPFLIHAHPPCQLGRAEWGQAEMFLSLPETLFIQGDHGNTETLPDQAESCFQGVYFHDVAGVNALGHQLPVHHCSGPCGSVEAHKGKLLE